MRYYRRRSIAGPVVLIAIGVIFLLGNLHYLSWSMLRHYIAHWWPALLILWGVIKLIEHLQDQRAGLPSRGIGAGGVLLIIFLILIGSGITASDRFNWGALRGQIDGDVDIDDMFGNSYNYSATMEQALPANGDLRVVSDRGDVAINTWAEPKVKVVVRKKVVADNEEDAKKIDAATQPTFSLGGNLLTLNANTGGAGQKPVASDLEIYMPAKGNVDIATRKGDIRVAGRQGTVTTSSHGDVTVTDNTGNVTVMMRRGNVRTSNIKGDVSVDGRVDDTTVSDVTGQVKLTGDFFGQMNLTKIAKAVSFRSSRTDMQMERLDGELIMESGDLRVHSATGPMHVQTRAKDIHLEDVSGALKIDNSNGMVEYRAGKGLGDVEINNRRGSVQVTLPTNAAFHVDARSDHGDIQSDFSSIQVRSEHNSQYANGAVGSGGGGPQIRLNADHGDVQIRQSTGLSAPPAPPQPPKPSTPGLQRGSLTQDDVRADVRENVRDVIAAGIQEEVVAPLTESMASSGVPVRVSSRVPMAGKAVVVTRPRQRQWWACDKKKEAAGTL